jgi:hypothetical protein
MFRPRRQHRKERLLSDGFLPYEANELSRNRITSPAMRQLRNERRAQYRNYIKECKQHKIRPTKHDWKDVVADQYEQLNWFDSEGRPNPFARLNEIVKKFKKEHPYHETPTKKSKARVSNAGDFQSTLKKTREKGYGKLQARLAKV